MTSRTVARRYAKGLLGAALEIAGEDELVEIARQLRDLACLVRGHGGLQLLLVNPAILWEKKAAVLEQLGERAGMHEVLRRFLHLLAEKERLDHLQLIADVFGQLVDVHRGVVTAVVTSPVPVSDDLATALRARLAEVSGAEVRLETRVDPSLLGGLVTRVGDTVYDGSLRTHLEKIREQLEA